MVFLCAASAGASGEKKSSSVPAELLAKPPAAEKSTEADSPKAKNIFTVDSSEFDEADSLNRISSGDYEPFLKQDLSQEFHSEDQYSGGALGMSRAHEKRD